MATADQIAQVRLYVNEPDDVDPYQDVDIAALIDSLGSVEMASSAIWTQKASSYAELVDVTEAGASRKMSDLHKNALAMSRYFADKDAGIDPNVPTGIGHAKTHRIVR